MPPIIHTLNLCLKMLVFYRYLIEFFILQFVQQFTQGFLPISFNNTWVSNAIRRQDEFQVSLRNDDDINIPFARTAQTERFPLTKFPKMWHNFPNENIKFQRNKLIFNKELKKSVFVAAQSKL